MSIAPSRLLLRAQTGDSRQHMELHFPCTARATDSNHGNGTGDATLRRFAPCHARGCATIFSPAGSAMAEDGDLCLLNFQHLQRTVPQRPLAEDNSTFGRHALVKLAHVSDVHELVCNAEPDAVLRARLDQAGVRLTVAP
ncbi:hypothetical protein [Rhizobium straminoryzae]|uniref:DeoR C-terminal sensor domain-containing protein n=1 Tax=Rhizobium straminoryzae TaxID=1387186 RepID=A0A549T4S3_9HYPH|nr:hypothetical protein [Rhizobium straminoryzae]TRL36854.1 hypothetical protein FNA46_16930 [Rhizobium straminoryzae]